MRDLHGFEVAPRLVRVFHPLSFVAIVAKHPYRYICGHGHCYVCIRLWLEHDWGCPECRTTMTVPPFRVFAEDKIIARMHGAWDLSTVDYSWEGLEFPYMLPSDSDDI